MTLGLFPVQWLGNEILKKGEDEIKKLSQDEFRLLTLVRYRMAGKYGNE